LSTVLITLAPTHLIDDTEAPLETEGNNAEQTNRNGDNRMLQEKCHADAERGCYIQRNEQPENSHEIDAQDQEFEDQYQKRVPEYPRVLHPYSNVRKVRIQAMQNS